MSDFRMDRVNSQLMREISRILMIEVKDDAASLAIVTSVECSRDLKYAKVFFTTLETKNRGTISKALAKSAGFVRKQLGSTLHYRTVPQLTFIYDDTEDKAREMDQLLDRVAAQLSDEEAADLLSVNGADEISDAEERL